MKNIRAEQRHLEAYRSLAEATAVLSLWLNGNVNDTEMRAKLKSIDYKCLKAAGLTAEFDEIAQVGCVIEMLDESQIGGDEPYCVRKYAYEGWMRHIRSKSLPHHSLKKDIFNLLSWEKS